MIQYFFQFRFGPVLLLLLLLFGCSKSTTVRPTTTWIDLDKISNTIEKPTEQTPVLDAAEASTKKGEPEPRSRDLTETADSSNRYLQEISSPQPKTFPKSSAGEGILLNFDNADIYEVIQVMAETLNLNYIIDPQVKGVVNIRSGDKISLEHLYDVFKKILNMNGLDIRQEGEYEYIFVAKQLSSPIIFDAKQIGSLKDSPRMVSSTEATKLINPYLSNRGSIFDLANQNIIILTDFEAKIIDALVLLARIDISPLSSLQVRLIKVEQAPLFTVYDELNEILNALKINRKDHEGVTITPLERVNSLLLLSSNEELLNSTDKWIRELDVIPAQGRDNIYIYNVRNSVASELESLVSSLIGIQSESKKTSTKEKKSSTSQAKGADTKSTGAGKSSQRREKPSSPSLDFAGEPILLADDSRNIILIRGMPSDYQRILKLLERLDNLPRQVLIEVVIAEVRLSDAWQLGVEWTLQNKFSYNNGDYTSILQTNFDNVPGQFGFTFSILDNMDNAKAILHALAGENDLNLLSSPHVMVLNNETATVNVGQEVPIATSQTVSSDITVQDVQTIQYRDTGIILTVTPRINDDGIIIMEIEQQVSAISDETVSGIDSPLFRNRQLKTKLAVKDGQPILMGGLIDSETTKTESGVPGLKDVPLLGWLFKYESEKTVKQELLILITPYVIDSEDVFAQYIREFDKTMTELRKELTSISKIRPDID
jgi:general secretion pathway protein D